MFEVGVDNLYIAVMTSETESAAVYDTPVAVPSVKSIGIANNATSGTQSGDNRILDVETARGTVNVDIALAQLPAAVRAVMLGHTIHATDKTLIEKDSDRAPYIALGFRSTKSDGKGKYVWLYKGKALEPNDSHQGKGEGVNYNSPSMSLIFVSRLDGNIRATGDEGDTGFTKAATWFDAVYEEPAV